MSHWTSKLATDEELVYPDAIGTPKHHRARKANRTLAGDDEGVEVAGRDLRAANLATTIMKACAASPPFTAEQIAALRSLLDGPQ